MKAFFVFLIFITSSLSVFSQDDCDCKPFLTMIAGGSTKPSYHFEVGGWPTNSHRFGGFFGFEVNILNAEKYPKQGMVGWYNEAIFHSKGQYRLNRYLHFTGTLGVLDFKKLVTGVGIRGMIPLNSETNALTIEPQYRTDGFRVSLSYTLAIKRE